MTTTIARLAAAAGTAAVALALSAAPASAHIGTSEDEVAAGSSMALGLTVGHGCEDSPTTEVAVQVPEGVNNAAAVRPSGVDGGDRGGDAVTAGEIGHGEETTERVSVITFTAAAGNALRHDVRDTSPSTSPLPRRPGETLWFKTIQSCEEGENAWIEEWDGEGEEPERLAPSVVVREADEEGGHDEATSTTETDGRPATRRRPGRSVASRRQRQTTQTMTATPIRWRSPLSSSPSSPRSWAEGRSWPPAGPAPESRVSARGGGRCGGGSRGGRRGCGRR